ncbi:hypothetical protein LPB72_17405 [Hydrogenophaga crassostreae]|uniref:Uncharacterized protein n=1 Tax=Hydrogenophaga crassostreae TaxID=1763535 RepID=A0A167GWI7_9BURK|nr:hypothetical protein LPB072_07910 [Hydrogenophaga crassostreae]OAD39966.1 hypothetical protein LPB72_17405 [Hydrogenophaga crassostreae]
MEIPQMNSNRKNHHLKLVCILTFAFLAGSQVHAAQKGTPQSQARSDWCKSKMDSCVSDANDDCDDTYSSGTTNSALCKSSEVNTCKNAYGSTSDCMSRDRVSTGSRKAQAPAGQKAIEAPEGGSRSPKDRLKGRAQPEASRAVSK